MEIIAVVLAALLGAILGWVARLRESIRSSRQDIYLRWLATIERYRGEVLLHQAKEGGAEIPHDPLSMTDLAREAVTLETQLALLASEDTYNKAMTFKAASIGPSAKFLREKLASGELEVNEFMAAQWQLIKEERRALIEAMRKDLRLGVFNPRTPMTK